MSHRAAGSFASRMASGRQRIPPGPGERKLAGWCSIASSSKFAEGIPTAPARMTGMRAQGEAKITIANNQLIPLPEPARRGLLNLGDDLIATANQAVAAAALLDRLRCAPTLTV